MLGHKTSTNASPSRIILSNITQAKLPPCRSSQTTSQYYFVLQRLHKARSSTTLYYKACAKHVPSTTLYYKACKKYFPVLLCTTIKACTNYFYFVLQSLHKARSMYYFVLQSLHKVLPTQSLHPVLLCTTKLAKSTSQYYFVLRSLCKALPSTTLYYKACTKYVQVLLCDTKLAQRMILHTASSFAEKLLHTASFLNREAFTHRSFYTQQAFTHNKLLHTASF